MARHKALLDKDWSDTEAINEELTIGVERAALGKQGRRGAWYIEGYAPLKHKFVLVKSSAISEADAYNIAERAGMTDISVNWYNTRSEAYATQQKKAKILAQRKDINVAIEPIRHRGKDIGL